jgi:hypothetical protein
VELASTKPEVGTRTLPQIVARPQLVPANTSDADFVTGVTIDVTGGN